MKNIEIGRPVGFILVLTMLITAASMTQRFYFEKNRARLELGGDSDVETFYVPPKDSLKLFSFGNENLVADLLMIRAAIYFGEHIFGDRQFDWLETFVDSILELDPYLLKAYEFGMITFLYGESRLSNKNTLKSVEYARRGLTYFPDYWRFYFWIGFTMLFEYDWKGVPDEERKKVKKESLALIMTASMLPGNHVDPVWVYTYLKGYGNRELSIAYLKQKYFYVDDEDIKTQILRHIKKLQSKKESENLVELEYTWNKNFPYLPADFFFLIGPKVREEVPLHGWEESSLSLRQME